MKKLFKIPFRNLSIKHSLVKERYFEVEDKTGLMFSLIDRPGILADALKIFSRNNINLSYINSKPSKFKTGSGLNVDFFVDLEGKLTDEPVQKAVDELKKITKSMEFLTIDEVPWFPKSISDVNHMGRVIMPIDEKLAAENIGFQDEVYRKRRDEITIISNKYDLNDEDNIPGVEYTEEENRVWKFMWDLLVPLHKAHACREFNENFEEFERQADFNREKIPQLKTVTRFLKEKTGFIYRPVGGLLSQREFLNGLAFKIFHSTQYIRHGADPLYTLEPDVVHELMGHAVLFANKDFADFSQAIGLASLGASDEDVMRLGNIYWFTVEFGICLQDGEKKAYGSGIMSSPSEMEWAMSDKPKFLPFDLEKMAVLPFPVSELQPHFFVAPSFAEMKRQVLKYSENIKKPFNITYNSDTREVGIDRKITTRREAGDQQLNNKI